VSVSEPENDTLERNDTDPDTRRDLSPVGQNSTLGTKPRSLLTFRCGNFLNQERAVNSLRQETLGNPVFLQVVSRVRLNIAVDWDYDGR
jgi:hypothetical protein